MFGDLAGRSHSSHVTCDRIDARLEAVVERIVIHSTHVREAALALNGVLSLLQTSAELSSHGYLTRRRNIIRGNLTAGSTAQPALTLGAHDLPLNPSPIRCLTYSR